VVDIGSDLVVGACKSPWPVTIGDGRILPMPCGKCLACRIRRRSAWTIRMLHEIQGHKDSSFITLTYADEHLPIRGSDLRGILVKSDLQKFWKRLRKHYKGREIKYYACGEYGDKTSRPHYHSILFGLRPTEEELSEIWQLGRVDVGSATTESIRYVSGYVSKKLGLSDYENSDRPAPFQNCSQGMGLQWAQENFLDVLRDTCIKFNGKHLPVPRAYLELYKKIYPEEAAGFSAERSWAADLALTELILELTPQFGGRKWEQLNQAEQDNFIVQLRKKGKLIDVDLRKKEELKEYKL